MVYTRMPAAVESIFCIYSLKVLICKLSISKNDIFQS